MAIQNLRSSDAHKRPIPTVLSAGQIAINTNQASPGLFFKDSNGDLVKVGPVHIGTSAPNSSPATTAADALVSGTVYQILTVGNTDFTAVGASANTVGTVFTATGAGTGTGTVSGQQGNEKGEQWLDTTGGTYVLKIYDGTAWRSESGTFVDASGDNMTGNLTLGTDKVVLNATSGNVTLEGDLNTGTFSAGSTTTAGTNVLASGQINIQQASGSTGYFTRGFRGNTETYYVKADGSASFASDVQSGGNPVSGIAAGTKISSSGIISAARATGNTIWAGYKTGTGGTTSSITADGVATFASNVQAGGDPNNGSANGCKVFSSGAYYASRSSNSNIFVGFTTGTSSATVELKASGAATFAGLITGNGNIVSNRTSSSNTCFQATLNGSTKATINADGSATFNSSIQSGEYAAGAAGSIQIFNNTASAQAFKVGNTTNGSNIAMKSDGSATFAGAVTVTDGTSNVYSYLSPGGNVQAARAAQSATASVWEGYGAGSLTSKINSDGSATFAGQLRVNNQAQIYRPAAVGGSTSGNTLLIFKSDVGGTAVTKASITTDGAAEFVGNTIVGSDPDVTSNSGCKLFATGTIRARSTSSTSSGILFEGFGAGQSSSQFKVNADGSAIFAGPQTLATPSSPASNGYTAHINNTEASTAACYSANNHNAHGINFLGVDGANSNAITCKIMNDGSATFGVFPNRLDINAGYLLQYSNQAQANLVLRKTDSLRNSDPVLEVQNNTAAVKSKLYADGSAEFKGDLTLGSYNAGSNGVRGLFYTETAGLTVQAVAGSTQNLLTGLGGNSSDVKFKILANGAATFGAFDQSSTSGNGTIISHDGQVTVQRPSGSSSFLFRGFQGTTQKYFVKADGSAEFAGGAAEFKSTGELQIDRTNAANTLLGFYLNGSNTGFIRANGSASFASDAAFGTGAADSRITLGSHGTAGTNNSVHIRADSQNLLFMCGSAGVTKFEQNGTQRLLINDAGNVMIGQGDPSVDLHVKAAATGDHTVRIEGTGTSGDTVLNLKGATNDWQIAAPNSASVYGLVFKDVTNNRIPLFLNSTGNADFAGGYGSSGVTITDDGEVRADSQITSNRSSGVCFSAQQGGSQKVSINADGSASFGSGNFIISSGGTILADNGGNPASAAKVNINSNGSATFAGGISSNRAASGDSCFIARHNGTANAIISSDGSANFGGSSTPNGTSIGGSGFITESGNRKTLYAATTSNSGALARFFNNNGQVGVISVSGTGTAYVESSDYRLKENVVDITDGIARVKQLQPRRFNFIADANTTVDGFLAHEAQTVVPEAVIGTHNEVDEDGNAVMQGIDKSKLVPLLTAALQEAIAKIETLEAKVAALEAG
mgnify:CR=1 FL=1